MVSLHSFRGKTLSLRGQSVGERRVEFSAKAGSLYFIFQHNFEKGALYRVTSKSGERSDMECGGTTPPSEARHDSPSSGVDSRKVGLDWTPRNYLNLDLTSVAGSRVRPSKAVSCDRTPCRSRLDPLRVKIWSEKDGKHKNHP